MALQTTGDCQLCGRSLPLELSHVLPAFVFKWQRESSGNGHLRSGATPNVRVQDGEKRRWLCRDCEERFSKDERAFATYLFYPYLANPEQQHSYGPWLLRFCTSVSWRVLRYFLEKPAPDDWLPEDAQRSHAVEAVWRDFLMGRIPHPGAHRQHILPFDTIKNGMGGESANINRYLTRVIQMDLCRDSASLFTFAKLGRFAIFGIVHEARQQGWKGTQIQANAGQIGPRDYTLPGSLWPYLNDKARLTRGALESISDRQRAKIDESFRANVDRFAGSDSFRAMEADVGMFGSAAFRREPPADPDKAG